MSKWHRHRDSLRRRPARLTPRLRILVVCEGEVTEPSYLREFQRRERNRLVDVRVNDQGGVPKTLVERAVALKAEARREAKRQRDTFLNYDEIWCVFDVDNHPNIPDARQQAQAHGIRLAMSNPCFELWLLIHFQDQTAHIDRNDAKSACRKYMTRYEKLPPFEVLGPLYEEAVARAEALEKRQRENNSVDGNPSTGVHHLTERIRELRRNITAQQNL